MASITEIAEKFFVACDEEQGWEGCKAYCKPDATFSVQAEPLADIENLEQYTEWMKGLFTILPDLPLASAGGADCTRHGSASNCFRCLPDGRQPVQRRPYPAQR